MAEAKDQIAKYLKGELSPSEMHALEKRALEDPFIAEALEGFNAIEPAAIESDLSQLTTALQERTERRASPVIQLWRWPLRIAAGLLILFIAGLFLFNPFSNDEGQELALQSETSPIPNESDDAAAGAASNDDEQPVMRTQPHIQVQMPSFGLA